MVVFCPLVRSAGFLMTVHQVSASSTVRSPSVGGEAAADPVQALFAQATTW